MQGQGVQLVGGESEEESADLANCIICQSSTQLATSSEANGRKRIRDAADVRNDRVAKRLRQIGDDEPFVYHMDNNCYKKYTHKKTLDAIRNRPSLSGCEDPKDAGSSRSRRSSIMPRPGPSPAINIYQHKCVVCGCVKKQGLYQKYRISEMERAAKFLEATVGLQDEVYVRTCDLQSVTAVFGADLYCHNACIKNYLVKYERMKKREDGADKQVQSPMHREWASLIPEIETGINEGKGFELSYVRDCLNEAMESDCSSVTNREVAVLLMNYFGKRITFSRSKQVNKSFMFFGQNVTAENMAETIRDTDPIRQCGEVIRQCLMDYDFGLQDRFCDANDLKQAWKSMRIPNVLLKFLGTVFNFDIESFEDACKVLLQGDDEEGDECETEMGVSKSRCRQMLALFQTMFYVLHSGRKSTPLHVLNSQSIYDTCKSATLITNFNRFGLCCSYQEVMRNHVDLAMYNIISSENGVPFPSHFSRSEFTHAAFDNFDHNEATLSGIGGSHDTVTVLFQNDREATSAKPRVSETRVKHGPTKVDIDLKCQQKRAFFKPAKKPDIPSSYTVPLDLIPLDDNLMNQVKAKDVAWLLARLHIDFEGDSLYTIGIRPECQVMPSWSATNSVFTTDRSKLKRVAFLPVLPYPVTQYDTVYSAMKNLQDILQYLDQSVLPVTCDEGVFCIAREIQLIRPGEFQNLVLCLGTFHMAKIALGCIGKFLKGSGAENILVESGVFGVNVVDSVLSGKNYTRSLKGIQLLKEALCRLQWSSFFAEDDNCSRFRDMLVRLVALKEKVASRAIGDSVRLQEDFQASSADLMSSFKAFTAQGGQSSETFKFWDTFINLASNVENLIRSDREANWELHLQAVQALLPMFAAFDSTNYLRWSSLYLEDMRKLPENYPQVHQAFKDGEFAMKRSVGNFKAVGADMALEQTINRSKKSSSGIIGSTQKKQYVAMWDIIYHEMLGVSNLHRDLSGVRSGYYQQDVNSSFSKSETEFGEKNIQAILTVIENKENPFRTDVPEPKLHNIMTQEVMTDLIRDQLLHVETTGTERYEKFRQERLVEKSVRFFKTIHRMNLKTFSSIHEKSVARKGGKISQKTKPEDRLKNRVVEISRARGRSMRELIEYDLSPSYYLFDEEGLMSKSIKSGLMKELESNLIDEDQKEPNFTEPSVRTAYIVDVMANVRKISPREHNTFGEYCSAILDYVSNSSKHAHRIDLVFDSYIDLSVKDSERKRREGHQPIELNLVMEDTPLPVEMDRFWPSNENKHKLQLLLAQQAISRAKGKPTDQEIVMSGFSDEPCMSCCSGSSDEVSELCLDIEEADSRIIPHALHAVKHGVERIVVLSADTDIFVLLLYYWQTLQVQGLFELWMKAGVRDSTRHIPIHLLASRIGLDLCKVLPAVHTLTGCDYTSKVGTKPAAIKANPLVLEHFGISRNGPTEEDMVKAESYLVQVMKKGTTLTSMDSLRDQQYHHSKGLSLHELPPTSHAIQYHIKRAYYATHEMTNILSLNEDPLNPLSYGFEEDDETLVPVRGVRPIPEEFAIYCNCSKCATERWCSCRQNKLPCCTFCKCHVTDGEICCKNPIGFM